MRTAILATCLVLAACEEGSATMSPGEDCTKCHGFKVAGTVFPAADSEAKAGLAGVTVTLVDSAQKTLVLTSNSAGNFFSEKSVAWPAQVSLTQGATTVSMKTPLTTGACNSCHTPAGTGRVSLSQ